MTELFVSYARADAEFVEELASALEERGMNAWVDRQDIAPSTPWMDEIEHGIEKAEALLTVVTPASIESEMCRVEVKRAESLGKRILPVVHIDPKQVPKDASEEQKNKDTPIPAIAERNWIFWRSADDAAAAISGIEEALQVDPEWAKEHTRLLGSALEWERNDHDKSHLLRGSGLVAAEAAVTSDRPPEQPQTTELQREFVRESRIAETSRQRRALAITVAVAAVSITLAVVAVIQFFRANDERDKAEEQRVIAEEQRDFAEEQQQIAEEERAEAIRQRDTATSTALASLAENNIRAEPDLAALLALEAYRTKDTVDARGSLLEVLGEKTNFLGRQAAHETSAVAIAHHLASGRTATGDVDGVVVLWADDTEGAGTYADEFDVGGWVTSLAFTPDGSELLVASWDGGVTRWDVDASPPAQVGEPTITDPSEVVLTDDGALAAGLEEFDDGLDIVVYDVENGEKLNSTLAIPAAALRDLDEADLTPLAMSPDGGSVAFGVGQELVVWPWFSPFSTPNYMAVGDMDIADVASLSVTVKSVGFTSDSANLVFGIDEGNVYVTSIADGISPNPTAALPEPTSHATALASTTLSGNGFEVGLLASAHQNGEVKLWFVDGGAVFEATSLQGHDEEALAVEFGAEGQLVSGSWDGDVIWWESFPDARLGSPLLEEGAETSHTFDVNSVEYPRDDLIVALDGDDIVKGWDPNTGGPAPIEPLNGVTAIGATDEVLVIGRPDGSVEVLIDDVPMPFNARHDSGVVEIAIAPDHSIAATQDDDGAVWLWNVEQRAFLGAVDLPDDFEAGVLSFPALDGLWVGGALGPEEESYATALKIDPATGATIDQVRHNADESGHFLSSIALSPDGSTLATGGTDRRIFIWDTTDLSTETAEWAGHRDSVNDLVFVGDESEFLVAADGEGRILVWDVESGRAVGSLTGPTDGVNALALHPDGTHVTAGSEDDMVWVWDLRIETWLDHACDLAGRNMTEQEWARYRLAGDPIRHCGDFGPDQWPLADYEPTDN